jgi:V/A-type H+-transporting ATPase subunit F
MKSFLISDNKDTWVGMQLAGIDGVILHTREEILEAIAIARKNKDIGILILTELTVDKVRAEIMDMKLKVKSPLIVEIPDRHASSRSQDRITKYIEDSIGVKL